MIASATTTRWQRWRWPMLLAILLLGQAGGVIAMVVVSGRDPSFAVEPAYYEKALAWDDIARDRVASDALGWTAGASLHDATVGQELVIALRDGLQRTLDGATLEVELYHHARAADRQTVQLTPRGDGVYASAVRLARPGIWQLHIRAERGPDTLLVTQDLRVEGGRQ